MKFIIQVCAFLWLSFIAHPALGQPIFSDPGPLVSAEVAFNQANIVFCYFYDSIPDTLSLKWRRLEFSSPLGWDIDLCDYGQCYSGVPFSGVMLPAPDSANPFLKLIVQPGMFTGSAWIWFRVARVDQPASYRDIFFSLRTPGTTAVCSPVGKALQLFPNPVSTFCMFLNEGDVPGRAELIDWTGCLRASVWLNGGEAVRLSTENLEPGGYLVSFLGEYKRMFVLR